jgi:hypothetical protein
VHRRPRSSAGMGEGRRKTAARQFGGPQRGSAGEGEGALVVRFADLEDVRVVFFAVEDVFAFVFGQFDGVVPRP